MSAHLGSRAARDLHVRWRDKLAIRDPYALSMRLTSITQLWVIAVATLLAAHYNMWPGQALWAMIDIVLILAAYGLYLTHMTLYAWHHWRSMMLPRGLSV